MGAEVLHTHKWFGPMDRPVTVGAQHRKILQAGFQRLTSARQGASMMNLAYISSQAWVRFVR